MAGEWSKSFVDLNELYLLEFYDKIEEGNAAFQGILNYLTKQKHEGKKVLDIPCGIGRISSGFIRNGFDVTGVDISEPFLKAFRRKSQELELADKLHLINSDMKDIPKKLKGTSFDLIINWWTSFGYSTYEDDLKFFTDMTGLSKRDTILLVETWHREYIENHRIGKSYKDFGDIMVLNENVFPKDNKSVITTHRYFKKSGRDLIFQDEFTSEIKLYSRDELTNLFEKAGWQITDVFNSIVDRKPFDPGKDRMVIAMKPSRA